jgi:hypothetical protein
MLSPFLPLRYEFDQLPEMMMMMIVETKTAIVHVLVAAALFLVSIPMAMRSLGQRFELRRWVGY